MIFYALSKQYNIVGYYMYTFLTFQLPSEIHNREIARLAPLFSPDTMETVALQHFNTSQATVKTFKAERRENAEGFKRDLLTHYRNKGHKRKVIIKKDRNPQRNSLTGFSPFRLNMVAL